MATPNPGGNGDILYSISADDPSDVWAVGTELAGAGYGNGLILHYDGAHWKAFKVVSSPTPLVGVKATSATNVWAVGRDGTDPLILHFDGTKWRRQSVKAPAGSSILSGIGATSSGNAFAVGDNRAGATENTLVYHFS
jgi:hypothetical protein